MPNLFMEFPLQAPAELAWQLWSDFQGLDRYLPVTIQGGTNSNEIGAVRILRWMAMSLSNDWRILIY